MSGIKGKSGIYQRTEEMKEKMSKVHLGQKPWNKDKKGLQKHSAETRKKMSESHPKGENHPNWKGGVFRDNPYLRKLFLNNRRRATKAKAEGSHTQGEWELLKKQYGYVCPACGKGEPNITLTEDHIIPLSRGGSDYIENIQPLCKSCNSTKHTEITHYKMED